MQIAPQDNSNIGQSKLDDSNAYGGENKDTNNNRQAVVKRDRSKKWAGLYTKYNNALSQLFLLLRL